MRPLSNFIHTRLAGEWQARYMGRSCELLCYVAAFGVPWFSLYQSARAVDRIIQDTVKEEQ